MDRKPAHKPEIERLIRLGADARAQLGRDAADLQRKLDVPARVRDSLRSNPAGWLGGSAVAGLAASLLFRRKKKTVKAVKKKTLAALLLGLVANALTPLLKIWLTGQLKQFLAKQARTYYPSRAETRSTDFP